MGSLFRQRVSSDNIQNNSIFARHFGDIGNNAEWQTMTCPISPCSDYTLIWDNSVRKFKRITIDRLRNDGI